MSRWNGSITALYPTRNLKCGESGGAVKGKCLKYKIELTPRIET